MTPSARMIVELNLRHYRELLATETDAKKRTMIARLLAEEEAKLAELNAVACKRAGADRSGE